MCGHWHIITFDESNVLHRSRRDKISRFLPANVLIMQAAMVTIFRDHRLICFLRSWEIARNGLRNENANYNCGIAVRNSGLARAIASIGARNGLVGIKIWSKPRAEDNSRVYFLPSARQIFLNRWLSYKLFILSYCYCDKLWYVIYSRDVYLEINFLLDNTRLKKQICKICQNISVLIK